MTILQFPHAHDRCIGAFPFNNTDPPGPPDIEHICPSVPAHGLSVAWIAFCFIFVFLASLGAADVVRWAMHAMGR